MITGVQRGKKEPCECCGASLEAGMYHADTGRLSDVTLCRECVGKGSTFWDPRVMRARLKGTTTGVSVKPAGAVKPPPPTAPPTPGRPMNSGAIPPLSKAQCASCQLPFSRGSYPALFWIDSERKALICKACQSKGGPYWLRRAKEAMANSGAVKPPPPPAPSSQWDYGFTLPTRDFQPLEQAVAVLTREGACEIINSVLRDVPKDKALIHRLGAVNAELLAALEKACTHLEGWCERYGGTETYTSQVVPVKAAIANAERLEL